MRQVRFWIWENGGPVMMKLRQGQTLHWFRGRVHEEGFASETRKWCFDGAYVFHQWHEHCRDCDGRYWRGGASLCAVDELRAGEPCSEDESIRYPAWEHTDQVQRDYAAEAMGY